MTSVSQPTQPPSSASNNNGASQSAQSYASATRKAVSSPPVATGSSSQSPAVAVGNVAPVQHGKSSSISPVNGRSSIPPAVPVVSTPAIASSNGNAMEHSRKSSVTINGGYVANGSSKAIQFGSLVESPAATHSTPQISQSTTSSAPIAIPSNPRVTSPAQSPSPIPQPTASGGGRPPAGLQSAGMTFGSHPGGDGDVSIYFLCSLTLIHCANLCSLHSVTCDMLPYHRHLLHQAHNLAMTDDFPEKAVWVAPTEVASTLKAAAAVVTATPTRTSTWDTLKVTSSSAALQTRAVAVCLDRSLAVEDLCHSTRTRHTRQTAAPR